MVASYTIAICGATGLVGKEMLKVLAERKFPVGKIRAFASQQSVGSVLEWKGEEIPVLELQENSFEEHRPNIVLFGTSAEISAKFAPLAAKAGALAIDNSSHFRMNPEIPLIVPEVNPEALMMAKSHKIVANPNCSTIQLVVALKPIHDRAKLKRVIVSSYQSVSGAGADALLELEQQVSTLFSHGEIRTKVFPHQIAFNCLPHIDSFLPSGFTKEEMKIVNETRKIMSLPNLRITATAVRVPTFISHSESVNVETEDLLTPEDARDAMSEAGVMVLDDPSKNLYPLNFSVTGRDEVFVGRVRTDESVPNGLHLWVVADNLRKGAATNAVQIAELALKTKFI